MSGYQCPRCIERGKTWPGSDPRCGFREDGSFNHVNWNCATLNGLRALVHDTHEPIWHEDDHAGLARVPELQDAEGRIYVAYVLLRWYKNRGATPEAYWLAVGPPRFITLREAEFALARKDGRPGSWEEVTRPDGDPL